MDQTAQTIAPEQIDESFVPRPVEGMAEVVLGDGELVLLDGWRAATATNAVGALIWGSFDGASSLGDIVRELSVATGADPDVVRADVLAFTRQLGAEGYLRGVAPPGPDVDVSLVAIPDLEVGEEVADAAYRDLDGREHHLHELRGRPALVVNWSPHCGYCWIIAERLGALTGPLEDRGVQLIATATGGVDENRAVAEASGVPVWIREDETDPFLGHGTPCCYHVDVDGRLLATIVHGSDAVLDLASELAGVDPVTLLSDPDSDPVPAGTRYLMAGDEVCAADGRGGLPTTWAGLHAYRLDGFHVGVRYDHDGTGALLDALFRGRLVRDRRAGYSYSVALPGVGSEPSSTTVAAARGLNLLVVGGTVEVRSRYASRVLRALLWRLDEAIHGYDVVDGHLRVQATAAVVDGSAFLLPPGLNRFSPSLQPRFARAGIALADLAYPEIDLRTAELVVPEPGLDHDPAVLVGLDPTADTPGELAPVGPGRYPLLGWGVIRPADQPVVDLSPAVAAAATLSLQWEAEDVAERVRQLGGLFRRVRGVGLWYDSEQGLVDAVALAVRGGSSSEASAVH